jgi:hypothetical protein
MGQRSTSGIYAADNEDGGEMFRKRS